MFSFPVLHGKKVMLHTQNPTCFAIARIAILSRKKCDQIRILYHYFFHQFLILNNRLHTKIIGKVFFLVFFLYDSLFLFCCERISSSLMWFKSDLLNWVFQPLEGKKKLFPIWKMRGWSICNNTTNFFKENFSYSRKKHQNK